MQNEPDFRRVAFVTRRFHELQGLTLGAVGAALIAGALSARALGADDGMFFYGCMQTPLLYSMLAAEDIRSSYRRTFGDAAISATRKMLVVLPALLVFLGAGADSFKIFYGWPGPSILAIVASALGIGVLVRDWPWRIHHLAVAAAGVAGIAATLGAPLVTMSSRASAVVAPLFSLSYALIGFSLVAVGLLDHQLLASSMSAAPARPDPQTTADRALERTVAATAFALMIGGALGWTHGGADELTLAWELAMALAFCMAMMLRSIFNARRKLAWLRRRTSVESPPASIKLPASRGPLLGMCGLALAATLDTFFMTAAVPLLTCAALVAYDATIASNAHERPWRLFPSGITLIVAVLLTLSPPAPAVGFLTVALTLSLSLAVRFLHEWILVRRVAAES